MNWGTEWDQTEDVVVTFGNDQRVKFVVGVCSELAMGKYRSYLRQAQRWIDETYSFEWQQRTVKAGMLKPDEAEKLPDDLRELYDMGDITFDQLNKWAAIRAALRGVYVDASEPVVEPQILPVPEGQDAPENPPEIPERVADWQKTNLPSYWLSPGEFMESVPTGLVSALYMQVNALNPGVFTMWAVGTEKKIVRINIGASSSSPKPSSTRKKK